MMPVQDYDEPNYWLSCITLDKESKIKPLDIIKALEAENNPSGNPCICSLSIKTTILFHSQTK